MTFKTLLSLLSEIQGCSSLTKCTFPTYSGNQSYGHLVKSIRQIDLTFFGKKQKKTLSIGSTLNTAKRFWPIGDRINGVPVYLCFLVKTTKKI